MMRCETPAAILDLAKMRANIKRMRDRMNALGVSFRPHVKTSKCEMVVREQMAAGAKGITVSTMKEAERFFAAGITDITYAVGISQGRLAEARRLMREGCALTVITDNAASAGCIAEYGRANGVAFSVLIEIDTDGHRSGVAPEDPALPEVAAALQTGGASLAGVLTHAGSSYGCEDAAALEAKAEQERSGCVRAAVRLRAAGHACPVVSVGSTPTALAAKNLAGVTEVRAGVYVFFDLVMRNVGVCTEEEIALSVLTTVIGHQKEKGWAIVDAGWMAMSRDRGTAGMKTDYGYGQVCDVSGAVLPGYIMSGANQEHGIISLAQGVDAHIAERFPIGARLRVLPNHACATAAQFPAYHALDAHGGLEIWPRFYGW